MTDPPTGDIAPDQPAGSRVVVEDAIDGVTITVPPVGIWRAARWMLVFGLLWCAVMALFSSFFVRGLLAGKVAGRAWLPVLVLPVFWAVGLLFLLGSINMGRRRAVLAVVGDRLLVLVKGPFGAERREWPRADLRRIDVGPSEMVVNNVPVPELHIQPVRGKMFGLLAARDPDELRWLAARLRRALKL
ncbi:MAG TPA: hypothetical protein VGF55_01965 [Gemmataceae bacterium]|jgi:hypothetical protein